MINRLYVILLSLILIAAGYSCSSSSSLQIYTPPEKKDIGNNEFEYVSSPLYEGTEAGAFDPNPGSPEAAVVKFLAGKARGDNAWKSALIPEFEWTDRLIRKLNSWSEWKITKWQFRNLHMQEEVAYLTVYFEIVYDGGSDDGEDEFELTRRNGIWLITAPPT